MLVARARTADNDDLLILGLSAENRRRLVLGSPIDLTITTPHGPLHIVIFTGESEESMQADLFALIDDHTQMVKIQEET
jgi:hypothetical protein